MDQQAALNEIARLEALMDGDPGAVAFPALAEAQRRAGRAKQAELVARAGLRQHPDFVAGRVALSLALLDLGRTEEAQTELRQVLEMIPDHALAGKALGPAASVGHGRVEADVNSAGPLSDLADDELEIAFQDAEAQSDEMVSTDRVVAAALRDIEHDKPEGVLSFDGKSPFATPTMAELLEQQNHGEQARELRRALTDSKPSATLAGDPGVSLADTMYDRDRVVAILERWLENLRRGSR